jgi:hypothetical protein
MWGPGSRDAASLFPTFKDLGVRLYEDALHWNAIAQRRPRHPHKHKNAAYT